MNKDVLVKKKIDDYMSVYQWDHKRRSREEEVFEDFTSNHVLFDSILSLLKATGISHKVEIGEIISHLYDVDDYIGERVVDRMLKEYDA